MADVFFRFVLIDEERSFRNADALLDLQQSFGFTQEDIKFVLMPMGESGQEGTGSMGNGELLELNPQLDPAACLNADSPRRECVLC